MLPHGSQTMGYPRVTSSHSSSWSRYCSNYMILTLGCKHYLKSIKFSCTHTFLKTSTIMISSLTLSTFRQSSQSSPTNIFSPFQIGLLASCKVDKLKQMLQTFLAQQLHAVLCHQIAHSMSLAGTILSVLVASGLRNGRQFGLGSKLYK